MSARTQTYLDELNHAYVALHTAKEDAFWTAMMGLADDAGAAQREHGRLEVELGRFLQDPERLRRARAERRAARQARRDGAAGAPTDEQLVALEGWERTFEAHAIDSAEARALAEEIVADEGTLAVARGAMELGYDAPGAGFTRASSTELGVMLNTDTDPARRRAAWEGLRSIERHALEHGFLELVRKRNRVARSLGAEDYYDWRVRRNEGMTKADVFALLSELEGRTAAAGARFLEQLGAKHGPDATEPWNVRYLSSGDATREEDPYFPFAAAVERWGRSFHALGIRYAGAELVLDLLDRRGKHENGFMHGPEPAWREAGTRHRARIHFAANAIPHRLGSGKRASQTLFHEGGHAAHFANIDMPAPCFAQEFAPSSPSFAETQSMFLDSLLGDADWRARYARDRAGAPMPADLRERVLTQAQAGAAWHLRAMLGVCYAERALYEIPDDELTPERALAELRGAERELTGLAGGSTRPALSIPHLISGDASAYYHSYVLALMGVHQTRAHFLERDGHLVDNPRVGPALRDAYWRPGNSKGVHELVNDLTGSPLNAGPLADHAVRTPDEAIADARAQVERLAQVPEPDGSVELDAAVRVVHGRETVAELDEAGFDAFAQRFDAWIEAQPAPAG